MNFFHAFLDKKTHRHWLRAEKVTFCTECTFGKKNRDHLLELEQMMVKMKLQYH